MHKSTLIFAVLAAILGFGANALAQPLPPCVVTRVGNGSLFSSGAEIPVFAVSSRTANCPASPLVDFTAGEVREVYDLIRYTVDRWNSSTSEWERVGEQRIGTVVSGGDRWVRLFTLSFTTDGRYRLTAVNGETFLENIHFTVGGTGENTFTMVLSSQRERAPQEPYFHSARVTSSGYLYFRGFLGGGRVASGYLFQDQQDGKVEILPVDFEEISGGTFNQQHTRGGILDLLWVRVKLPNNSFDPTRPVYASVTRDGGGVTVQGVVFDPMDPAAHYTGGFGGEYRINSR